MAKLSVDALHRALLATFEPFHGKMAFSDFLETLLALVTLKAAEERVPHGPRLSARHLLPRVGKAPDLETAGYDAVTWKELAGLEPEALRSAIEQKRLRIEGQQESLADSLNGLLPNRAAISGPGLQKLIGSLANIPLDPAAHEVPWALGAAMDRLILNLAHAEPGRGENNTGRGVASLIARISDPAPGMSVHDPASGACRLLVECASQVASRYADRPDFPMLRLSGMEIDWRSWRIGRMNLWACGLDGRALRRGDSLMPLPEWPDGPALPGPFDRVVCNPPMGWVRMSREDLEYFGLDPEWLQFYQLEDCFVGHAQKLLVPGGRAVVVVPQRVLFHSSAAAVRRNLIEKRVLRAVVQLPGGLLLGTSIPAALLVIEHRPQPDVVFVDARSAAWDKTGSVSEDDVEVIRAMVAGEAGRLPSRVVPFDRIAPVNFNLTPDAYLPTGGEVGVALVSRPYDLSPSLLNEFILTQENRDALIEIEKTLAQGGFVNLVGGYGSGKSTLLAHLRSRLSPTAVVSIVASGMERGGLVRFLGEQLSPWKGREGRLVLLLDEWERAAIALDEVEYVQLQRLLLVVITRGPGSGVVFASTRPLVEIQEESGREALPISLLATTKRITLGAVSRRIQSSKDQPYDKWEAFLRHLAMREKWIVDECRALGLDLSGEPGSLQTFLQRTDYRPEALLGELLRPTDLQRLFPGQHHSGEKSAVLREAFRRWVVGGEKP